LRTIVKTGISKLGLEYDDLSKEIWIPEGASFKLLYETSILKIEILEPFYVFLSKAIKAPEKNKQLILQAISLYGVKLLYAIDKNGGNSGYFIDE